MTLPVLRAWQAGSFQVLVSQPLLDELDKVWQRPRLRRKINAGHATDLLEQLNWRGIWVELATIPPRCRDPKDHPVLSTAIDGKADAIVSGDGDLRARSKITSHFPISASGHLWSSRLSEATGIVNYLEDFTIERRPKM
ncbi:MAG: putative toxin-antitoxin system toxin component, PIN family, partial [Dissulfuribacterales bacterium]